MSMRYNTVTYVPSCDASSEASVAPARVMDTALPL